MASAGLPTEEERLALGDGRSSLEQLYTSKSDFMGRVDGAARSLVARRLLLEQDLGAVLHRAEEQWQLIVGD